MASYFNTIDLVAVDGAGKDRPFKLHVGPGFHRHHHAALTKLAGKDFRGEFLVDGELCHLKDADAIRNKFGADYVSQHERANMQLAVGHAARR